MFGERSLSRRSFIGTGALAAGALAFGPAFWRHALAAPATAGPGPYGPLGAPDANGISLPSGFRARQIAKTGEPVANTAYPWHVFPDGQATYAVNDGGWVLVSNSESLAATGAGSSSIRFGPDGRIVDAFRILAGTNVNCAGGRTPWGTWLSCEEFDGGQVWEADPLGRRPALNRPAMGFFQHEAAAVDPIGKRVYMTEDEGDGAFYRFTPTLYPDLSSGVLEVMIGAVGGPVRWVRVPDPSAISGPTRNQVPGVARFSGGEGIWYDSGFVYFSAKGDNRIYAYDTNSGVLDVLFDGKVQAAAGLSGLDNLTVSRSGDLFVCEDNGQAEYSIGVITRERQAAKFLTVSGSIHQGSELAGVIFDPSGKRMYFSSQRAHGTGATYEVTGPFRTDPPPGATRSGAGEPAPLDPDLPGGAGGEDGPRLKISAAKRTTMSTLLRRGVVVNVSVDRPSRVTVALRTAELDRRRGQRGSSDRPRMVTIATATKVLKRAGRHKVVLKPRGRIRRRLKGRKTMTARYTVQARARTGFVQVVNRRVRVLGSASRRR